MDGFIVIASVLVLADKFASSSDIESVLCVEEVIEEDLLFCVLLRFLDRRVVQGSHFVVVF